MKLQVLISQLRLNKLSLNKLFMGEEKNEAKRKNELLKSLLYRKKTEKRLKTE